jgi:sterol desaturase/sphingolipid hydroxylase (fatty acid hydroxylase superfamily)
MLDLPPEMLWRLAAFVAALSAIVWLETVLPRRPLSGRARRWRRHLGLVAVGTVLVALVPLTVTGAALWAQAAGIGLFNAVDLPPWASVAIAWLLLDAAIYAQHRALHAWPLLWRLHRVHHTDTFLDASTALRFHPFELLLSALYKSVVVVLLGAPALAVLLFEALLAVAALFNHANLRLAPNLDAWLRRLIVTPDMHRVHHSVHRIETDSNYGNVLSVWDHLFRSYRAQPADGHLEMRLGQDDCRDEAAQHLGALLSQPMRRSGTL